MSNYQRPMSIDTIRYNHSDEVLKAFSKEDEYFVEEKAEDPLVLIVDALLSTLPDDEREVVEMCLMAGITQHEAARMLGYINSSGKEDHKMVKRRIDWALKKLRDTLESPSFAVAIAGHKMPVHQHEAKVKETISKIIDGLEKKINEEKESRIQ